MDCICEFKTESFKALRCHFTYRHGNEKLFLEHFSHTFIENWRLLSRGFKRYVLFKIADNKCSKCGYCKTRECGASILEIDHIDGNTENNAFENFQVLCPNCHALTPKYRNWGNHGNKKTSARLRKGNVDYFEKVQAMINLREMKSQFQNEFKDEVLKLFESGEIDFSKYGWIQSLAEKMNDTPQNVGRNVKNLLPTFYVENCFKRNHNLYEKRSKLE